MIKFELDDSQNSKLKIWLTEQDKKTKYHGAIGGVYQYIFIPTSLGMIIKVKNSTTNEEIELSEYESW